MNGLLEYKLDLIAEALNVYRIQEVDVVMRRQHTNDDGSMTDIIDFYPAWNAWGTYGKMKVCHEYMNEPWQVERFETYANVKLDALPIYEGQQALRRSFGKQHPYEIQVRPFRVMIQPRQDEEGNDKKTLILRYLTSPRARREAGQPPTTPPVANGNGRPPATPPPAAPVRAQTPDTPHQSAATKPQAKLKTAADWEQEALVATDPLIFDASFAKSEPWFKDSAAVGSFRDLIFGHFVPEHTAGYIAGLKAYKDERLKANGSQSAHNRAKTLALQAFRHQLGFD